MNNYFVLHFSPAMSKPVVTYFAIRGRAEPIRMVLKAAGADFEDRRITFQEWPALKPKTPTGVLPFVNMPDGRVLTESLAIARYFAFEHGFMGNGHWDVYLIERVMGTYTDIMDAAFQVHFAPDAEKPKKREVRPEGCWPRAELKSFLPKRH